MKYQIIITKQADKDLREIYEYIAYSLCEPVSALKQMVRIEKSILSLDEMPGRFRLFEREPWHSRGLCQMPVDNFIVFYIPQTEDKTVTIIRVIYGRMDIYQQF